MHRLLRAPILHFLLLGALFWLLRPSPRPVIEISGAELARLERDFAAQTGRAPEPGELAASVERAVDERILEAEAWRLGLDRDDSAVATRLARIGGFVAGGPATGEPAQAVARARALGLDRADPVVRRYLTERMRQLLARGADPRPPTEAELEAHLRVHAERFRIPERIALRHVSHGRLGDPSQRPRRVVASRAELDRRFGPGFADALDRSRVGAWQGPIAGAHGRHWVWIESVRPERLPALAEVRTRVAQHWREARREQRVARRLGELRERYEVRRAARIAATSSSGTSSGTGSSAWEQTARPSSTVRR